MIGFPHICEGAVTAGKSLTIDRLFLIEEDFCLFLDNELEGLIIGLIVFKC